MYSCLFLNVLFVSKCIPVWPRMYSCPCLCIFTISVSTTLSIPIPFTSPPLLRSVHNTIPVWLTLSSLLYHISIYLLVHIFSSFTIDPKEVDNSHATYKRHFTSLYSLWKREGDRDRLSPSEAMTSLLRSFRWMRFLIFL